jgi:putative heme-binding domain-containing protein
LSCHKVGDTGGTLGPDLSAIGRGMTPEAVVEAVFWPKRQVKEGYMLTQVTTKDGQVQAGYIAGETAEALTLKDLSGNAGQPIAKPDITTRSDTGTLMPDGLTDWMSEQQQFDLLRYLFDRGSSVK